MESQIPRRIPRVLPLVRHGNHIAVQHVEPLRVTGSPLLRSQNRMGVVFQQPLVEVEIVILFRPQHSGERLPVHTLFVLAQILRRNAIVEFVCIGQTLGKNRIEVRERIRSGLAAQPQANHLASSRRHIQDIMRRRLGPCFCWIYGIGIAMDHIFVESTCNLADCGPRLCTEILTRTSSGSALAYSTNTSKYLSSSKMPVSSNSYSNSSRERCRFVCTSSLYGYSPCGYLYRYFMYECVGVLSI